MAGSDDSTTTPTVRMSTVPPPGDAPSSPTDELPRPADTTPPSGPPPPAWRPAPADRGRVAPMIGGVVLLIIGLWFFATQTLGLDLPRLDWGQFWPLILIFIGIGIVARSFGRARDR